MYILTDRQKQIAADIIVPIPQSMYAEIFRGEHDIAFSKAVFLLARAARNGKATLKDVVGKILLMSCKRIVGLRTYADFIFEVTLCGETHRLRGRNLENKHMTIMLENEDV
jgi:hypothetical protein